MSTKGSEKSSSSDSGDEAVSRKTSRDGSGALLAYKRRASEGLASADETASDKAYALNKAASSKAVVSLAANNSGVKKTAKMSLPTPSGDKRRVSEGLASSDEIANDKASAFNKAAPSIASVSSDANNSGIKKSAKMSSPASSEEAPLTKDELFGYLSSLQNNFDDKISAILDIVKSIKKPTPPKSNAGRDKRDDALRSLLSPPLGDTAWMPRYRNLDDSSESERELKDNRRSSIMGALHQRPDPLLAPTVYRSQPSYEHIFLHKITVRSTFNFLQEISKYQSQHNIELPAATMVPETVKNDIMAKYPSLIYDRDFYELSNLKLFRYIQKIIRPEDPMAFQAALIDNISFPLPDTFEPDPVYFTPFYDALLVYRKSFIKCFEYLAEDNTENIPRVDNKNGGLVKIFLSKIPAEYGDRVLQSFPSNKFKTLGEFLDMFYAKVEEHRDDAKKSRKMFRYFRKRTKVKQLEEAAKSSDKTKQFFGRSSDKKTFKLNALQDVEPEEEEEFPVDSAVDVNYDYARDVADSEEELASASQQVPIVSNESVLAAVSNDAPKKDAGKNNSCFSMLFYNTCDREKCTYSHDRQALMKAHEYYSDLLAKSTYKPRSGANLFHAKPAGLTIINLSDDVDVIDDSEVLREILLNAVPELEIVDAVRKEASVELDSGQHIIIPQCDVLFDTGALQANYISKEFVDENREKLKTCLRPLNFSEEGGG